MINSINTISTKTEALIRQNGDTQKECETIARLVNKGLTGRKSWIEGRIRDPQEIQGETEEGQHSRQVEQCVYKGPVACKNRACLKNCISDTFPWIFKTRMFKHL